MRTPFLWSAATLLPFLLLPRHLYGQEYSVRAIDVRERQTITGYSDHPATRLHDMFGIKPESAASSFSEERGLMVLPTSLTLDPSKTLMTFTLYPSPMALFAVISPIQ
jgi:hypothetical protein